MENNQDKATFTFVNEEGKEVECEVLFTFDSEETKKSYIVYTDNTVDAMGSIVTYASIYDPSGDSLELTPIEDEREWLIVENVFASIQEKVDSEASEESA